MPEIINYAFNVSLIKGPATAISDKLEVEAYDVLNVVIPDKETNGGKAEVSLQPNDKGVKFLMITASAYSPDLKYAVDGGAGQTLDGPLVLIGEGAVKLMGPTQNAFAFENAGDSSVSVKMTVGRTATV